MMPMIAPTDRPFDELNFGLPPEEYVKPPLETYVLLITDAFRSEIDKEEGWDMLESDDSSR